MNKPLKQEHGMKRKDFLARQKCRCGAYLEYPEEQHTGMCWCCAAQRGKDIGAVYYYSTGIWQKPKRRPYKHRHRRDNK